MMDCKGLRKQKAGYWDYCLRDSEEFTPCIDSSVAVVLDVLPERLYFLPVKGGQGESDLETNLKRRDAASLSL
eukprot:scaffold276_cov132-Cylindrotheca_fusiformis.AAC.12